jgi:hypothetical protein
MSFALSLDYGKLEWGGDNLSTLFAQKRNLLRPSFLLMLREDPALQQDLPSRSRRGPSRRTLDRRLSQLARLLARLHEQLSGSHGGGDLVNTGQADDGVSGDLFRQLLRKPPADLFRKSDLAHRDRREPELSRQAAGPAGTASASMPAWCRSAAARRVSTSSTPPDGSKCYDRVILACHTDQALRILDRPTEQKHQSSAPSPTAPTVCCCTVMIA